MQKEKKPLKFMQVLQSRSAIPAVFSRTSSSTSTPSGKIVITSAEKKRMLQKAKRMQKGAFNSYLDPTENGSAVVETRMTGEYNVWEKDASDDEKLAKVVKTPEAVEYILPILRKPKVKVSPRPIIDPVTPSVSPLLRYKLLVFLIFYQYGNFNRPRHPSSPPNPSNNPQSTSPTLVSPTTLRTTHIRTFLKQRTKLKRNGRLKLSALERKRNKWRQ